MDNKAAKPTAKDLYESIFLAIGEYEQRHQGRKPAQITVTPAVFSALMATTFMRFTTREACFCNIPVAVTTGEGYHIHLAEPEIQIYAVPTNQENILHLPKKEG